MKKIASLILISICILTVAMKPVEKNVSFKETIVDSVVPINNNLGIKTNLVSATFGNILDTLSNATTHYLVFPLTRYGGSFIPSGYFKTNVVTATDSSISGTLSITFTLQRSIDGYNWYSNKGDTLTTVTAGGTVSWNYIDNGDAMIRVKATGSGTQSTELYGSLLYRKPVTVNN